MVPLELELNRNNNDLGGRFSCFSLGNRGWCALDIDVLSTGSVQKRCYYGGTLTSTNGLGLVHCYPGMHEAGEPVGYLQLKA